jgi:hypothetical protein
MSPKRPRKPGTILRELDVAVQRIHALGGWSDTNPDFATYRRLLSELRRALK